MRDTVDDLSTYLLFNYVCHWSETHRVRFITAAAVSAVGVFVLLVTVNEPESWWVNRVGGWLPVLLVPAIALVAVVFGVVGGVTAGLIATGLTVLAAEFTGGSLFAGWTTAPAEAVDVNVLGALLPMMFLAAGWFYGSNLLWALDRPRWQLIASSPVFPAAFVSFSVWVLIQGFHVAQLQSEPPVGADQYEMQYVDDAAIEAEAEVSQAELLARLDEVERHREADIEWFRTEMAAALERGTVDGADLEASIDTAIEEDWDLWMLVEHLNPEEEVATPLRLGLVAAAYGLDPELGAAVGRSKSTADHVQQVLEAWADRKEEEEERDRHLYGGH